MILSIYRPISYGMQDDDVARVQQALRALGREIPASELANEVMGTGTVAVLKAFQTDVGMTPTGIVDDAIMRNINANMAALTSDRNVGRGAMIVRLAGF
jgi:peptidoglycan hydrolase-like protein with peptidoglycan-binding domain